MCTAATELCTAATEYIICGDKNIDYLVDSDRKNPLEVLLKTYNLTSAVNFPTCTQKYSATAIDNIFIDISEMGNYYSSSSSSFIGVTTHYGF